MKAISSFVAGTALAFALATPASAQFSLCTFGTPFPGGNGGSSGWVVMFDVNVTGGFIINSLDCNVSGAAGVAVSLEVYRIPGTYVGSETVPGNWTLISTDSGGVLSAGVTNATNFPLAIPIVMTPGSYGLGVRVIGSGQTYTNGNGSNQTVSDTFMTLSLGKAVAGLFTGTINTPRVWNGCIRYTPATGLYPSFSGTPTSGASPLNVQFTDTTYTSDPGGILSWVWDFENDGTPDAFVQNPSHTYPVAGQYSVRLTATDAQNGTQSFTRTNYISVDPITANFTGAPTIGAAPLLVNFTDTSVGVVTSWAWDFDNDGITDSTQQNPSWVYATAGQYTVKLTAINGGQNDVELKTAYIFATGTPVDPGTPDMLQYQFNEPRGNQVANSASTGLMAAFGTANNSTWQADAGRAAWQGNEPGFGCVGSLVANWTNAGWITSHTGSLTVAFWMRRNPASTSTNPFGYAFSNGTFRAFAAGAAVQGITFRGSSIGNVDSGFTVTGTPGVWQHVALVIDNAAGQARWWSNGVPSVNVVNFAANTFAYTGTTGFAVGANGTGGTSTFSMHYDMDDFRMYSRALNGQEILGCIAQEKAAATTYGLGCSGPGGVPVIATSGGIPALGNGAFQIDVTNTEPGAPCAVTIGVLARAGGSLPLDLSFLLGAGCVAQNLPDLAAFVIGLGPSGSLPLGLPLDPNLAGAHLYCQALVFGTQGAASKGLDINLQN
ncbi:MAG: PKD domain-containing protein [Planctomycetes bacterium]|nr:PKD domain-containing protein [Planctomycetota bacterium]